MQWNEIANRNCSVSRALSVVGERWTLLILREAFGGARRFDNFRKRLEIARNVLTARLQGLVADGVLGVAGDAGPPLVLVHGPCGCEGTGSIRCGGCGEEVRSENVRAKLPAGAFAQTAR